MLVGLNFVGDLAIFFLKKTRFIHFQITFSVLDFSRLIRGIKIRYDVNQTCNLQFHLNLSSAVKGT